VLFVVTSSAAVGSSEHPKRGELSNRRAKANAAAHPARGCAANPGLHVEIG